MTRYFDQFGQALIRNFWASVSIALSIKLILAWVFPITGDEALFWQWGLNLYTSYYDHAAMTGLWVYLGQLLGDHIFFPRFIGILSLFLIFLLVYRLVQQHSGDLQKARLSSLAFVVSPLYLLFFPITTDTPLFFFSTLAVVCFDFGFRRERVWPFVLAGVFVGLALMSKYLIFFVAVAMGLSLLWARPRQKIFVYALAIFLGLLPFLLLHFYWAQQNCWWPLQFNVFNRVSKEKTDILGIFSFLLQQLFLLTPWVAWALWRYRHEFVRQVTEMRHSYMLVFGFAFLILGAISYLATGLHWGLSLYPLIYLSLWILPQAQLQRICAYSATLSGVLVVGLISLLILVPYVYKGQAHFSEYVMGVHGDELHQEVQAIAQNVEAPVLKTIGYTSSGLMTYHSGQMYTIFNDYGLHGRNSDQWVDYRELKGRNFIIVSAHKFSDRMVRDYNEYFESVEYHEVPLRESAFYIAIGYGFRYEVYREKYLSWVNDRLYQFRPGLPEAQCFFHDRYF